MHSDRDRTLALAGVFQAAVLTRALARQGSAPTAALDASVYSIFQLDAPDVPAVFGDVGGVAAGLRALAEHLARPRQDLRESMAYAFALLQLERKLARDRQCLDELGRDLAALEQRQAEHRLPDATRYAALADIYQRHISSLSPRIMVKGEPLHLQNPDTAARIRTALLAGIRAARLWQQCGGRRWQLLFGRRRLIANAKSLLDHIDSQNGVV